MVVGHHIAVLRDDDARTAGPALLVTGFTAVAASRLLLRKTEEFEERIVTELSAPGHLDLLDRLDIDHGFHGVLRRVGQVGILSRLVGGELRTEGGRTLHLALDVFHPGTAVGDRPSRNAAGHGRSGKNSQKQKCLFHSRMLV